MSTKRAARRLPLGVLALWLAASAAPCRGALAQRAAPARRPPPPPAEWLGLIGEYGARDGALLILERDGKLQALLGRKDLYPLGEVSSGAFRFPASGPYAGKGVRFARGTDGRVASVTVGADVFPRRAVGTDAGVTFHIAPLHPVDELRRAALAMRPPGQPPGLRTPDLVDLTSLDRGIKLDVRYATSNDFLGSAMYTTARAFLQRPAAQALLRAHRWLRTQGYGLLIHDAYRPWYVTRMFWDATPDSLHMFVADPDSGSKHNRGCAVDLSLYDLTTGEPVQMVGGYDEFSARSYADYPGGTTQQRWYRALLRRAMQREGFQVIESEWWHFDYRDWRRYPVLNLTFEQLGAGR